MPSANVRYEIRFSGRVQGVGFRYRTSQMAQDFDVAGYVRNLANGQVEMVVEGTESEAKRFLARIQDALNENISEYSLSDLAATGQFSNFEIRY